MLSCMASPDHRFMRYLLLCFLNFVTFHGLFQSGISALHLYALNWCNTDFNYYLFSTQLASASQQERTNFELHSSPSPPQLLCLVVKLWSSLCFICCCFSPVLFQLSCLLPCREEQVSPSDLKQAWA